MTPEEAGQRLLEGEPWVTCSSCQGEGYEANRPTQPGELGLYLTNDPCKVCNGFKTVLDRAYVKACELLGRPLPKRTINFRAHEDIGVAVVNPSGIKRLGLFSGTVDTGSKVTVK